MKTLNLSKLKACTISAICLAITTLYISCKKESNLAGTPTTNGKKTEMNFKKNESAFGATDIDDKVRYIISTNLEDPDIMYMGNSTRLVQDLGCDELNMIEIIMDIESEFDIDIPDEATELLHTIGDFVNYVAEHSDEGAEAEYEPDDTEISSSSAVEFTEGGITKRQWNHAWRFGKGEYLDMTFYGYSTELCKTKLVGGSWQWDSVTNQSYYTAGQRPQGTEFVKDGYAANYFSSYAEVQFTSHISYMNGGQPRATSPFSTYQQISKK